MVIYHLQPILYRASCYLKRRLGSTGLCMLHGLDLPEQLNDGQIRKGGSATHDPALPTDTRGSKLPIMQSGGYRGMTGAVHPPYGISGCEDKMTDTQPTYMNKCPIEALHTSRCMQPRTA